MKVNVQFEIVLIAEISATFFSQLPTGCKDLEPQAVVFVLIHRIEISVRHINTSFRARMSTSSDEKMRVDLIAQFCRQLPKNERSNLGFSGDRYSLHKYAFQ